MELRRRQWAILDCGEEPHVVGCPGQQRIGVALPGLRGVGVHEVEPGIGVQPLEQPTARRGVDDVPAHVRDHRGVQTGDRSGPLTATPTLDSELNTAGEQDLHADADPEHRTACRHPLSNDAVTADGVQPGHAGFERADTRYHQPVGLKCSVSVRGDFDIRPRPLQGALSRPQIA